jgi:catechol 2,3-dioxygenase-like lactoylglutathione lyase family enzyme
MEARISLITLGVRDLAASLCFYRDGLGFPTTWDGSKGVVFFQTGGTRLSLYPRIDLANDIGPEFTDSDHQPTRAFSGITLAHNVRLREEVDQVMRLAAEAGARILKPACETFWGGYAGYFADLDGHIWEIAWGAFPIAADGTLEIP